MFCRILKTKIISFVLKPTFIQAVLLSKHQETEKENVYGKINGTRK